MVFFACAKHHYHHLSRFEIENFTSHALSIESQVKNIFTLRTILSEITWAHSKFGPLFVLFTFAIDRIVCVTVSTSYYTG